MLQCLQLNNQRKKMFQYKKESMHNFITSLSGVKKPADPEHFFVVSLS